MDRMTPSAREKALDVLKSEATSLSRLRHPCILEMVEPLEETRSELIFATEPLLSSLYLAIPGSPHSSPLVDLDEVEIQKGVLQLCKGLLFLHTSARIIHSNISPGSILINNAGDWKIGGLGLTIPLTKPDGSLTSWEFPTFDSRMSPYTQRSFDYVAPEYALDEVLNFASDMYSLGCLMYAVHCKGEPPFKNFGNLGSLRDNAGKPLTGMQRLDKDLQAMLSSLITRQPHNRPTPATLPSHAFFSSLPISTLNFLDRSNFAAKSREEKISFMKGLTNVLDRFSDGLQTRKILPSLLEEMKDTHLLPYILPNVFSISKILSAPQFATLVLPSLKPLFAIKEPPQNMLTLLDNLGMLQSKTEKHVFREHVLPLVYNALESEHAIVQERALKVVPDLCETIDYAEVQGVVFPRVAMVFTKTRILSVKVATLVTFLSMVKTLDQSSLTQKLVPLLSKIRTKEPAVTMATLSVQEAMGLKVDREAVATLVLPQLWAMAMGPLLNVEQFQRFMGVIRVLGERVEKEHNQYLRDSQRIEDRSATAVNGASPGTAFNPSVDFASLVGGSTMIKADGTPDPNGGWEDDMWGSILSSSNAETPRMASPSAASMTVVASVTQQTQSLPSSPKIASIPVTNGGVSQMPRPGGRGLGAKPIPSTSFNTSAFSPGPQASRPPNSSNLGMQPMQPNNTGGNARFSQTSNAGKSTRNVSLSEIATSPRPALKPSISSPPTQPSQRTAPNYNISFSTMSPSVPTMQPSVPIMQPSMQPLTPQISRPGMGDLLTPSKPPQPSWGSAGASKQLSKDDWGDFDPLA